jgi:hypothetical protein
LVARINALTQLIVNLRREALFEQLVTDLGLLFVCFKALIRRSQAEFKLIVKSLQVGLMRIEASVNANILVL